MKTKELTITPPEGYEIDKVNSTLEHIVFKEIEKPKFPQSWKALLEIQGCWIDGNCEIKDADTYTFDKHRNVVPTKELAEAVLAAEQLLMLRHAYNGGEEPVWNNDNEVWCVINYCGNIRIDTFIYNRKMLSFINKETAQAFFAAPEIKKLLEIAKPLL